MKPYGIPRRIEIEYPDVGDIQKFALKGSVGRIKADEYHSYIRKSKNRKSTRRYFKKCERMKNKVNKFEVLIDV